MKSIKLKLKQMLNSTIKHLSYLKAKVKKIFKPKLTIRLEDIGVDTVRQIALDLEDLNELKKLAFHSDYVVVIRVARRIKDKRILDILSESENPQVRRAVAQNEYTPMEVIRKMYYNDSNDLIRKLCKERLGL